MNMQAKPSMLSVEQARALVLENVNFGAIENVDLLNSVGRVCANDVKSDIDVSPFPHSAMDGYGFRASETVNASKDSPVEMKVICEVAAGDVYEGDLGANECIRIMTGAEAPACIDCVQKYEIVDVVSGDGLTGSTVAFTKPASVGDCIRQAGEEARAGEVVISKGEIISEAGIGFLASCGALQVETYARPRVAIIATGSELVPPTEVPTPGHIRESNSYAMAACAQSAGATPVILPLVKDDYETIAAAVKDACSKYDFVVTTGGAANGDYDFIKDVVNNLGELKMTLVDMRPGKAQTFGIVDNTPVFGLPGNPAAAYCGFQMLIRPALRKMQGYTNFEFPKVKAIFDADMKKKDTRRIFLRSTLKKTPEGNIVRPASNQSSGLFSTIQRGNCLAVLPEGAREYTKGDIVECLLLDVSEDTVL